MWVLRNHLACCPAYSLHGAVLSAGRAEGLKQQEVNAGLGALEERLPCKSGHAAWLPMLRRHASHLAPCE
eukprot:4302353-Pyramimonas_sp.AAC.1